MLKLKRGDEFIAHDLIASCLFNSNFWSSYLINSSETNKSNSFESFLIKYFEQMSLNDGDTSQANGAKLEFNYMNTLDDQNQVNMENQTIYINKKFVKNLESVHIYESLGQMKLVYLGSSFLFTERLLEHSRSLCGNSKSSSIKTLFLSRYYTNQFLLNMNWVYAPIVQSLHEIEAKSKLLVNIPKKQNDEIHLNSSSRLISSLVNCLKLIYLLEMYFDGYLDLNMNITQRYINLLYIYMFESEVFLDKQIVTYMYLIYFKYANDKIRSFDKLNFTQKFPGIISFYDFYQQLLNNYDSSSFGDYVFSLYMIVPLQQYLPIKYRVLFWSDYYHLFKFIKFNTKFSKLLIPLNNFIHPNERNLHLIKLYSQCFLEPDQFELVSKSKFSYTILIAHLNSFIFEIVNPIENKIEYEFKKLLIRKFLSSPSQVEFINYYYLFIYFFL
jgi:hypothetical protein